MFEDPEAFIRLSLEQSRDIGSIENLERDLARVRRKIVETTEARARIHERDTEGFYDSDEELHKLLDRNEAKQSRLQTELAKIEDKLQILANVVEFSEEIEKLLTTFKGNFKQLKLPDKKLLVEVLVDRVEIYREFVTNEKGKRVSNIIAEVVLQFNPQLWGNLSLRESNSKPAPRKG